MASLASQFRVGYATVSVLLTDTLTALCNVVEPIVMPVPDESDWKAIANGFFKVWNFPNCIGAIDGKHIAIVVSMNGFEKSTL